MRTSYPQGRKLSAGNWHSKEAAMKIYALGADYLEAVLVLQKKKGMVRSVDLAGTWDSVNRVSAMQ